MREAVVNQAELLFLHMVLSFNVLDAILERTLPCSQFELLLVYRFYLLLQLKVLLRKFLVGFAPFSDI